MPTARRRWPAVLVCAVLLTSCGTRTAPAPTPIAAATPRATAESDLIRFALVGAVNDTNVWALFDGSEYSYNDYAVRAGYWPRLYGLSIPEREFVPVTARELPGPMHMEGSYYAASVPLRTDLRWTDGTPFTARDVAFTVNTVLDFQLGFDWESYYDSEWLDHAEATTPDTITFYFTRNPNVGVWQYGALQGPVVQQDYWEPRIAAAQALLPPEDQPQRMEALKSRISSLQQEVDTLYASTLTAQGAEVRQLQADLRREQGNLDEATNDLVKEEARRAEALSAAHEALHGEPDRGEPHLGRWIPSTARPAGLGASHYQNMWNAGFPGNPPAFVRADYIAFATRDLADEALTQGRVDVVLQADAPDMTAATSTMKSPTRSLRFLTFNANPPAVVNSALRRALACVLSQDELADTLGEQAVALHAFVPEGESAWHDPAASLPCARLDDSARLTEAVTMLAQAGYSWEAPPSDQSDGKGLTTPDGTPAAEVEVLTPASDPVRGSAASYVEKKARLLGLALSVRPVPVEAMDYAVLSSRTYDLALLGWNVSAYPGYLCDWFNAGGPFHYDHSRLTSTCGELAAASDLATAHQLVHQIEQILAEDVPMIPLYSAATYDAYSGVAYRFTEILGGLSGAYGAPDSAFPAAP